MNLQDALAQMWGESLFSSSKRSKADILQALELLPCPAFVAFPLTASIDPDAEFDDHWGRSVVACRWVTWLSVDIVLHCLLPVLKGLGIL
jgi:hypothetical protein